MKHPCTCKHESQDKIHGKGQRIFNTFEGPNRTPMLRCTVCTREIPNTKK